MEQNEIETKVRLLPKEASLLEYYFMGLPKWKCAKLAKYKSKNKRSLANTCTRIVSRYVSQAGKDDISERAGGHVGAWWRDLQWAKRRAKAKGMVKDYLTALKLQGEAIGVLKAREMEAEPGSQIIINTEGKVQKKQNEGKKPDKSKPAMRLVSLPSIDGESDG